MSAVAVGIEPFFLGEPGRRRFCVYFHPDAVVQAPQGLVFVPPFAEEMNKCRRMVSLLARRLATAGCPVLVPDLSGCGESEGEFREARWERWLEEVSEAARWLRDRGAGRIWLWGVRLGACLAAAIARDPAVRIGGLLLWQPVVSGQTHLTQFLRIRLAADLGGEGRETTKDLRARLARGETVEVAGYDLSPALASAIDRVRLADSAPPPGTPVRWFEVVGAPGQGVSPASKRVIGRWEESGADVTAAAVPGEPFWATQEITECPALIEATTRIFWNRGGAGDAEARLGGGE